MNTNRISSRLYFLHLMYPASLAQLAERGTFKATLCDKGIPWSWVRSPYEVFGLFIKSSVYVSPAAPHAL